MSTSPYRLSPPQSLTCDFKVDLQYECTLSAGQWTYTSPERVCVNLDILLTTRDDADSHELNLGQSRDKSSNHRGKATIRHTSSASQPNGDHNYWGWGLGASISGIAAAAIALFLFPTSHWGIWLSIGIFVSANILFMNPRWLYKRLLVTLISAGLVGNILDGTFSVVLGDANLYWQGSVHVGFLIAWVMVIGVIVWADHPQNACDCARQKLRR